MSETTTIQIRTTDSEWATRYATPVGADTATIQVPSDAIESVRFAGVAMVRFDLTTVAKRLPRGYANRFVMVPASFVITK